MLALTDGCQSLAGQASSFNLVQVDEVHQGRNDLMFETGSGATVAVATIENELFYVFNTILVTPEHFNGVGDAGMVRADHRHVVVDLDLARQFLQ